MPHDTQSLNPAAVAQLIEGLAERLADELARQAILDPVMIGIHTGGAWLARRLHQLLGLGPPLGVLDISFYRDDFTRIGMNPEVRPSNIPFAVDGRHVILVDDVIQSGRTIRAALNEIFDYGRPASVILVVLVERGGRELPIEPRLFGMRLPSEQQATLTGPEPLRLVIGQPKRAARAGVAG
jgi:pyrimidine operon attenuation protein / uracil phosphoribosyltransferase